MIFEKYVAEIDEIKNFLRESNAIEGVYDDKSLDDAWKAWVYLSEKDEMTRKVVLDTHEILMRRQKLLETEKGYFRKIPVYIGGREAMEAYKIKFAIADWCDSMNIVEVDEEILSKEEVSKCLHVDYEAIHPFVDGNGRTGRMFMNWWRIKHGLPILTIHTGKEQSDYYSWFKE